MSSIAEAPRPGEKGDQSFTPQVAFAMGEIKGSVENLRTDLREWKGEVKEDITERAVVTQKALDDHDARLRKLEQWKWMIAGAAAAGGLAGSKLLDAITKATL